MYKAIVIVPNEKTLDLGDILAIARSEAQKREATHEKMRIRAIKFIPECGGVYIAVYEVSDVRDIENKPRIG